MSILHKDLTSKIIKAYYNVYNQLGYGFLEKAYENAMLIELRKMNFNTRKQQPISVHNDEQIVGEYFADIVVDDLIILELKAESAIHPRHEAQLVNYLKATKLEVGLLFNFGEQPEFKRKIFINDKKDPSKIL